MFVKSIAAVLMRVTGWAALAILIGTPYLQRPQSSHRTRAHWPACLFATQPNLGRLIALAFFYLPSARHGSA